MLKIFFFLFLRFILCVLPLLKLSRFSRSPRNELRFDLDFFPFPLSQLLAQVFVPSSTSKVGSDVGTGGDEGRVGRNAGRRGERETEKVDRLLLGFVVEALNGWGRCPSAGAERMAPQSVRRGCGIRRTDVKHYVSLDGHGSCWTVPRLGDTQDGLWYFVTL